MGKPVISTPIEELKRFPKLVRIGKTVRDLEKYIKDLLSKPWPKIYQKQQCQLTKENSWEGKLNEVTDFYKVGFMGSIIEK